MDLNLTAQELEALVSNLASFSETEQAAIVQIVEELERRKHAQKCRDDLLEFCKHMDPSYVVATHHKKLAELLVNIAFGTKDRIAVSIPPRHGKSHLVSTLFPAWFLGKFPEKKVMMVSHTGDLAVDFGRKVRNIIADPRYSAVFPGITLAQDSKSAGRWSTNRGGEYYAAGVGASIAGRGADLLLVDDPHSEQDLLAGNFDELEKTYNWFTFGARTRLMSGGRVAVIHCLTGETLVLMGDGTEKPLRELRPGDMVAGYQEGALVPSRVLNWANQGLDRILAIKTTSGRILRANEKHPLLVDLDGEPKWVKVRDLKVGMLLIGMSPSPAAGLSSPQNEGVYSPLGRKLLGYLSVVKQSVLNQHTHLESASITTTKIAGKLKSFLGLTIGGNGRASNVALKAAAKLLRQKGFVSPTTTSRCGQLEPANGAQTKTAMPISSIDTESVWRNTTVCLQNKTASVQYADALQAQTTHPLTGKGNSGSTTATVKSESAPCCVTHATSSLVTETQKKRSYGLLSTYGPMLDQIVSITADGYEEVFDIQVEGTENFIANGLVSHNTRWHQDDLIGRLVKDGINNPKADQYEVFEFPAILDIKSKTVDENGEETETVIQKALWPEKFDLEALERTKASMPAFQWNAQYMQSPTAEEAAIIKREWWRQWDKDDPPRCEYVIMCLDAAAERHNRADYTALTTWGVFSDDELTDGAPHIILLNAIKKRVEFPELKDLAIREWKEWEPDAFIVEKKSAGTQLYQELRRMGIPVQEFTPGRNTGDKIARVNAVADILRSGMVWYPVGRRWAEELIEECVSFPFGSHDDLVDTTAMALARFRSGGFVGLPTDYQDKDFMPARRVAYY